MTAPRRIAAAVRSVVGFLLELANPRRKARAVPLGRVAIATVFTAAIVFVVYSLAKDRFAFPFVSERYYVAAEFLEVAGLDEDNEPPVSVAGVPAGKVSEVRYEDGHAVVVMELEEEYRGKVFANASARTRPLNGANILTVNITPGSKETGPLPEDERIPAGRTSIPVATDEALSIFDADTRAYLQVLTGEAAIALRGRGGEVALALRKVGSLSDSALEISRAFRRNRRLARRLVGDLETIFAAVAKRRAQLDAALEAGSQVLSTFGDRDGELGEAVRALPDLLVGARSTVRLLRRAAPGFAADLESLEPAVAALGPALVDTRKLVPDFRALLRDSATLGRQGGRTAADLGELIEGFALSSDDVVAGLGKLEGLVESLDARQGQIQKLVDGVPGVASTQDQISPLGSVLGVGVEPPKPENFGLGAAAGRRNGHAHSRLERMLGRALDQACAEVGAIACLTRFMTPGLPASTVDRNLEQLRSALGAETDGEG